MSFMVPKRRFLDGVDRQDNSNRSSSGSGCSRRRGFHSQLRRRRRRPAPSIQAAQLGGCHVQTGMKLKSVNGSGSKGLNGIQLGLICTMGQMSTILRARASRDVKASHPLNMFSIEGHAIFLKCNSPCFCKIPSTLDRLGTRLKKLET